MKTIAIRNFGDLRLLGQNDSTSKSTSVRVSWNGEFQETIRVATNDPLEAVDIVAEQLILETL